MENQKCDEWRSRATSCGVWYHFATTSQVFITSHIDNRAHNPCSFFAALNANNLAANRFVYVLITGCVDLPCYLLPMILLRFMGRKTAAFTLFTLAGISLLIVLAIPQGS